jgi:hypothetical protein
MLQMRCTVLQARGVGTVYCCSAAGLGKKQKDGALHYTIHTYVLSLTFVHLLLVLVIILLPSIYFPTLVYISLARYPARTQTHIIF